jgi:exopolysaccharide biosynthesis polyprenyl glycosylphosphotransferase
MDSVPLVAISCNVANDLIGRDAFQEIYIAGITIPITKMNYFVNDIDNLEDALRDALLKFCYHRGIRAYVVPEVADLLVRFGKTVTAFDVPMVQVKGSGLTLRQRLCKRALDLLLVITALIPAAPIMAAVALAIRLEDGGPVFYRQRRMTQNGREFDILKFRSMIPNAEKHSGAVLASRNDPRITRVGHFIRATRLDELPQLLNILKGDMSIVGPRPERREIAQRYSRNLPEFDYRLKVPGGLTGYAQIYGKYNTTPADKLRLDLIYIENYSLLLDIRLILLTLRILFTKESTQGVKEEPKCS